MIIEKIDNGYLVEFHHRIFKRYCKNLQELFQLIAHHYEGKLNITITETIDKVDGISKI